MQGNAKIAGMDADLALTDDRKEDSSAKSWLATLADPP
jgi:hypothetical protein